LAFKANKYAEETRKGSLEFEDGSILNFTFYPNRYTPRYEQLQADARNDIDATAGSILTSSLLPLLVEWDVVNEEQAVDKKGKPVTDDSGVPVIIEVKVPITEEGLRDIPIEILGAIMRKIGESITPGEKKGAVSTSSFA
jgi:hypothetical protein